MRKTVCLMLLLFVTFVVCSCGLISPKGSVIIISDGHKYVPVENWIYELSNNTAADGLRRRPEEMSPELSEIVFADDFKIVIKGRNYSAPEYLIYSLSKNETVYRGQDFKKPTESGKYIVCIEIGWGNSERYAGYQYFFKINVQD